MTGIPAARPGLSCGLSLATALVLALALHRAISGLPAPAAPTAGTATEAPPALHLLRFEAPPPAEFAELTDRPPFSPTRRPPMPTPVETPRTVPPPPAPPDFRLTGVSISEGGGPALALIGRGGTRAEWLSEGESIDGWRVVQVDPRRVRLRDELRKQPDLVLELTYEERGGKTRAQGAKAKDPVRPRATRAQPRRAEESPAK